MRFSRIFALLIASALGLLTGCNGSSTTASSPATGSAPPSTAALNISMRDMPMMNGYDILAFRATVTGAVLEPGDIPLIHSPMTIEMTQLQSMASYLNTISVPAGNYTGMTVTFSNPQLTFFNGTGFGGMMGGGYSCPAGQICQYTPATLTASETLSGAPFPLNVEAGTPLGLMMDFDLMDSLQGTSVWSMGFSPMMSGFLQQPYGQSGAFGEMFDQMDEMPGVVTSVDAASQQFTMQFVMGAPTLTIQVDDKTVFDGFDDVGKANTFASLAAGQIIVVDLDLEGSGTLYASEVELENVSGNELYGLLADSDSAGGWCDFVVMNEAPDFSGVQIGDVVRANLQPGTSFDVNFQNMPMGGFNFGGVSDLLPGQMIQFAPLSGLASSSGTPPQVNVNHLRLMSTWVTGTIAEKLSATDFTFTPTNGIFPAAGIQTLHVTTSTQTRFDNVSGLGALNVGDTVSLRGPMFAGSGGPAFMVTYILKR